MNNTIQRKAELDKYRDRIVMQHLKCGGRLYVDDYFVFGFDDTANMLKYLKSLLKNNIVRGSVDNKFRKYYEIIK